MLPLLLRDLGLVGVTVMLWVLDAGARAAGAGSLLLGVATGVMTAVVGFLAHEWGHLIGSLASGARVHFSPRLVSPLLFHFDSAANDRRQFFWMSAGGYLASLLALAVIAACAPLSAWSGRVALALGLAGVVATLVLELPITLRVARGAPLPRGEAYRPHDRGAAR